MKKKFLSTLIIGGILCSGSTLVFAKENPKSISHENININSISNKTTCEKSVDLETLTDLSYSIEDMNKADSILNNADLTDTDTYNKMLTLAATSLNRIRTLKEENITEEMNKNIDFISSVGEEIRVAYNNANELNTNIKNVQNIFSSSKKYSNEEKETALYALNDIIVKNTKEKSLNKKTLEAACSIFHKYDTISSNDEENSKKLAYNIQQMNYAIEEMKEACRLLDTADLSKLYNYERMIRFATASLDRSRGLNLDENNDLACHLDWIEESGNSIRNTTSTLNKLITTIREEKEVFAPYSHATIEEKKKTLAKLDELMNNEAIKNHLNKTTLENVEKLLSDYHNSLNDNIIKTTTVNTKVDSGVGTDSITETDLDNTTNGTQTNITIGIDDSTETNLNNTVTVGTQTDLDNTVTTGVQADINIGTDSNTQTDLDNTKDIAIGTDDIAEVTLNNTTNNNFKNEVTPIPVKNNINTSVKTDIIKNEINVATEVKKDNNITIGSEKKTSNKIRKAKTPVSAVATQTDIAPVSAVATQTDIAPVSVVATQTDIVPVSTVANETDITTTPKTSIVSVKNQENINKKEEEKDSIKQDKETKSKTKKIKKTSYELLGLGLITTLICALLKKFI